LGQSLCKDALGNNFGKQVRGTALGNNFGKFSETILRNNCFEEQQLWGAAFGTALQTTTGSSFQSQFWGAAFGGRFAE